MSVHGLLKIHHAITNEYARADYEALVQFLTDQNRADIIIPLPEKAGSRRMDRIATKMVKQGLAQGIVFPKQFKYFVGLATAPEKT